MQGGDEEMQSTRLPRACKRKAQAETPPKREIKAATRSSPRQATPKDANEVTYTVAEFRRMCREDRDAIQYLVYSENTGAAAGAIDNRSSTSSPKPSTSKSK